MQQEGKSPPAASPPAGSRGCPRPPAGHGCTPAGRLPAPPGYAGGTLRLHLARRLVVEVVEPALADADDARMVGQRHHLGRAACPPLPGIVRMDADGAPDIREAFRQCLHRRRLGDAHADRDHPADPGLAGTPDHVLDLGFGEVVQVAVAIDQHRSTRWPRSCGTAAPAAAAPCLRAGASARAASRCACRHAELVQHRGHGARHEGLQHRGEDPQRGMQVPQHHGHAHRGRSSSAPRAAAGDVAIGRPRLEDVSSAMWYACASSARDRLRQRPSRGKSSCIRLVPPAAAAACPSQFRWISDRVRFARLPSVVRQLAVVAADQRGRGNRRRCRRASRAAGSSAARPAPNSVDQRPAGR